MTVLRLPWLRPRPLKVVVIVCASLVAAAVAAEAVVRVLVGRRIASAVESRFGGSAEVDLGGSPVVPQTLAGGLSSVRIDADDLAFGPIGEISVGAEISDLSRSAGHISASRSRAHAEVSAAGLAGAADVVLPTVPGGVTVVPHPEAGQLELRAGPAGIASVVVTPSLSGSVVSATVSDARVAGRPVDRLGADGGGSRDHELIDLSNLPLGLKPTALTVTADGLSVSFADSAPTSS